MKSSIKSEIISVEWDGGKQKVSGFKTRDSAERYIRRILRKIAPEKDYDIITYIPPTTA